MWEPTTGCAAILPQTGNSKRFPFPSIAVKATCSSIPCWKIRAANVFGSVRKVTFFQYFPSTGQMKQTEAFHNNSIKSLALDGNGYLLAGTDNGLYVYHNDVTPLQHIIHDSRNIQSLTNNIIWNIFADQEHNIWLGTDYGISLSRYNSALQFIPISQITVRETEISSTPYSATQKVSTLVWRYQRINPLHRSCRRQA